MSKSTAEKRFPSTTHDKWVLDSVRALLQRPIAYHRALAEQMGSVAGGVFASQLLYWSSRTNARWFYKTDEEIRQETGLTERELRAAKRKLSEISFINSERKGMPAKTWYSVDLPGLLGVLGDSLPSVQSSSDDGVRTGLDDPVQTCSDDGVRTGLDDPVQTCSDDGVRTTPETTTESTTKKKKSTRANGIDRPAGVSEEVWKDALAHRVKIKAPLSTTAWRRMEPELRALEAEGWNPDDVIGEWLANGWRAFKADWIRKRCEKPARTQTEDHWE